MDAGSALFRRALSVLMCAALLLCASCDKDSKQRAAAANAPTATTRPAPPFDGKPLETAYGLSELLGATSRRDFKFLFDHFEVYGRECERTRQQSPPDQHSRLIEEYREKERVKFTRNDCESDLQTLLNLTQPPHQAGVIESVMFDSYEHKARTYSSAWRHRVLFDFNSASTSPIREGKLLRQVVVEVMVDGATGSLIHCASVTNRPEAIWDEMPLTIQAMGSQLQAKGVILDVRVMGGTPPVTVVMQGETMSFMRLTREMPTNRLTRQATFTFSEKAIADMGPPSRWILMAYDANGDVRVVAPGGDCWVPKEHRVVSDNMVWWVSQPWMTSWQWNQRELAGIMESRERDLLFDLRPVSAQEHSTWVTRLNRDNELRASQQATAKVERTKAEQTTKMTVFPKVWSVPIQLPPDCANWELKTYGRNVLIMLSSGDRYQPGQQRDIKVPWGTALYFMSAEKEPINVELVVTLKGELAE